MATDISKYGTRGRLLGEGTYGEVYEYTDSAGNKFAIKFAQADIFGIPDDTLKEIVCYYSIDSPNVGTLIEVLKTEENYALVLPLADGTLSNLIKDRRVNANNMKSFAMQLVKGMQAIRNAGILHCDLKPANILWQASDSTLKIVDFGIAEIVTCYGKTRHLPKYTSLYRAPEIFFDLPASYHSEVWALGCIFAEMYLGRRLFAPSGTGRIKDDEVLQTIFDILGTPTEAIWSEPYYSDKKFLLGCTVSPGTGLPIKDPVLLDLLQGMLQINPLNRFHLEQVCAHPYFNYNCKPTLCLNILDQHPYPIVSSANQLEACNIKHQILGLYLKQDKVFYATLATCDSYLTQTTNIDPMRFIPKDFRNLALKLYSEPSNDILSPNAESEWDILSAIKFNINISTVLDYYNKYDRIDRLSYNLLPILACSPFIYKFGPKQIALIAIILGSIYYGNPFGYYSIAKFAGEDVYDIIRYLLNNPYQRFITPTYIWKELNKLPNWREKLNPVV